MTPDQSQKVDAEIAKLIAETGKLNAETAKITTERQWYPAFIGAGFTAGVAGLTATLIKLFL